MTERVLDAARGAVRCEHRKVAIVGTGLGRASAPYGDPAWCVWALNEIPQPSFTRHFELHPMSKQSGRELAWLAACPAPCYVLDLADAARAGVRGAVQYPLRRLLDGGFRRYFTCTFAYQIALALLEGFEEVGLWGVGLHLGSARERLVERACVEYWLGVAAGRGARVSADSGLAWQPHLYGYDYDLERAHVDGDVVNLVRVAAVERGWLRA